MHQQTICPQEQEQANHFERAAGEVKYVWPLTQPISDLDTQKKRLQEIRASLGWPLVGCELMECYDESPGQGGSWLSKQFTFF